jgi:hypothetical protein
MPSGAGIDPGKRTQYALQPGWHNPYSEQWTIGVQRSIGSKQVVELRYNGSRTVGEYETKNGNIPLGTMTTAGYGKYIPAGLTPCSDPTMPGYAAGYIDCSRTRVIERGNFAFGRYDALQSRWNLRDWHGLMVDLSYTYSRNLDNSTDAYTRGNASWDNAYPQNPFDPTYKTEEGISGIAFPHVASIVFNYALPFGKTQSGALNKLIGGWEISTTWRYNSGEAWAPYNLKTTPSACDPGDLASSSSGQDVCRPILLNSGAPLNTAGQINYKSGSGYTVQNFMTGAYVTPTHLDSAGKTVADYVADPSTYLSGFHWLANNAGAVQFFGKAPWDLGTRRNILQGDSINNANLAIYKRIKLTERFSTQLRMDVFNVLNRQMRGVPGASINTASTFANTYNNNNGAGSSSATQNGIGRRALQLALRIDF